MLRINFKDDYFEYVKNNPDNIVVVYGAGRVTRDNLNILGHIDYICDQNAKQIGNIGSIPCLLPEELKDFDKKIIILICIMQRTIVDEICSKIDELQIDAEVFYLFDNPAFSFFDNFAYPYICSPKDKLKICIVYINDGWIFGKFANKMQDELNKMGYEAYISKQEDPMADINHFISYGGLQRFYSNSKTIRTTMITHIDCLSKVNLIKFQAENNAVGICMSSETMRKLTLWGVPRDKICYVNPAHDGDMKPRKIVLGITNRCYHEYDFRKRDDLILKVCEQLNSDHFKLKIMGAGWNNIVGQIRQLGFEVEYYEEFDKDIYQELMPSLDYWLYYGFDEGAMGYLDALAAGVKTIATPQGYHLDTTYKITYPCSTISDFINILQQIQNEKSEITNAVKDWTWENYAKKHLEIWHYLTRTKPLKDLYKHQNEYMDGIFSMLISDVIAL